MNEHERVETMKALLEVEMQEYVAVKDIFGLPTCTPQVSSEMLALAAPTEQEDTEQETERKLASIQVIEALEPIPNADAIEVATVLGWKVVVKKGEFKVNDKCVFFEIDSVLPDNAPPGTESPYEFLRKGSWCPRMNGFRLKTIRMRGQISQGLALPLSALTYVPLPGYEVGQDLTEWLKVKKYVAPSHEGRLGFKCGLGAGNFPYFVPKTDEVRIQNIKFVLQKYADELFYVTEKLDGTSCTVACLAGEVTVCSRSFARKPGDNVYWTALEKYGIPEKLKALGENVAFQGEILGPGIQGNKYKLLEPDVFFFSGYHISATEEAKMMTWEEMAKLVLDMGAKTVPLLKTLVVLKDIRYDSTGGALQRTFEVEDLVEMSKGKSVICPTQMREGIVLRPMRVIVPDYMAPGGLKLSVSFKVVNPEFLLKHGE